MGGRKTGSRSRTPKIGRPRQPLKGRRFTAEQKRHALVLVASGVKRSEIAEAIGTTTESLRRWVKEAETGGGLPQVGRPGGEGEAGVAPASSKGDGVTHTAATARSIYAPKDPGEGLADAEKESILELKKRHPSMGPAQIRAQLKRFKGWRISLRAIDRVLRGAGYEPVHRGSRPKGEAPIRFEAPRPNALWQIDFAEFRVAGERLHVLVILDDFSRFVVGHGVGESPSAEVAIEALERAIALHGRPEAVRTDRGGAFLSAEFERLLEGHLIDHVVGRAYRPQGGGKVESMIGTLRRELWDVEHFADRSEAERRLADFIADYDHRRAHMGIDGLTPADRYFGRAEEVLSAIDAISRRRQGALARFADGGTPVEEILSPAAGAPLEVLRLVIVDGRAELRFCGMRVRLGEIEH